jgi:hypothetical protein
MAHDHPIASEFLFQEDRHTAVFLCKHVANGAGILFVTHDVDGDWQFLCGEAHAPEEDKPLLVCLEHVVSRDPTLNELAKLCTGYRAQRRTVADEWVVIDEAEEFIEDCVNGHGWAVHNFYSSSETPSNQFGPR